MARPRNLALLGAATLVVGVVLLGIIGLGPARSLFHRPIDASSRGGVVSVAIEPYPEGEQPPAFELDPTSDNLPLRLIESRLPNPWPAPLYQGPTCHFGGNLVVKFGDGSTVSYGPCKRPASVEGLRDEMLRVIDTYHPAT